MKKRTLILLVVFFATKIFAQNDSIPKISEKLLTSEDFFTDVDIALIDSLLIDKKFH